MAGDWAERERVWTMIPDISVMLKQAAFSFDYSNMWEIVTGVTTISSFAVTAQENEANSVVHLQFIKDYNPSVNVGLIDRLTTFDPVAISWTKVQTGLH